MIAKPKNYENINIMEEFEKLELGGHKGIIKTVEEYTSQISYNTSLKVTVDTDKNDKQPNYFSEQFKNDTRTDKKWNNGAIKYVSLKDDENCVRMLKAFITAVENSNQGFKYDWNKGVEQLNGKKIGLIFGLEEYNANDGKIKTTTKLTQFRSIDKFGNAQIPKVKTLNNGYVDYDDYMEYKEENANDSFKEFGSSVTISDDDLPFEL